MLSPFVKVQHFRVGDLPLGDVLWMGDEDDLRMGDKLVIIWPGYVGDVAASVAADPDAVGDEDDTSEDDGKDDVDSIIGTDIVCYNYNSERNKMWWL